MEMVNETAREKMTEAGMDPAQARAVASFIPDWSQVATKSDLKDLRNDLTWRMVFVMIIPLLFLVVERYLPT